MFDKITIRYQIFIILLIIIGSNNLLMSLIMNKQQQQVLHVYEQESVTLLEAKEKYLSIQIGEIENAALNMCLNNEFITTISDYMNSERSIPSVWEKTRVEKILTDFLINRSDIKNAWVHTPKGDFYQMLYRPNTNLAFEDTQIANMIAENKERFIFWGEAQENEFFSSQRGEVIPFVIRLRLNAVHKSEDIYVITLVNENAIYKTISSENVEGEKLLLMNSDRQLILGNDEELEKKLQMALNHTLEFGNTEMISHKGDWYYFSVAEMTSAPWYLIRLMKKDVLFGEMQRLFAVVWIILLVLTVASLLACWLLSRRITIPLEKLTIACKRVGEGEMSIRFEDTKQLEVRLLGERFNNMMDYIDHLIHELEEQKEWARIEQLLKRRAELKALQMQINPHFLYNTLESISWKAIDAGCDDISDMTLALATLFRTGLSQGKEMVTLDIEIKNIISYLEIQKKRYEDLLEYEILFDLYLGELFTVKLILQPLVENSIYHGLKEHAGKRGKIRVIVSDCGEDLEIDIQDTGLGFSEEEMSALNEQLANGVLKDNGSYGIYNVNERLRLYFGEEYGLHYEMDEVYTHAMLRFPKVEADEIEKYVYYYGRKE